MAHSFLSHLRHRLSENDTPRKLGRQTGLVDFTSNDYLGLARRPAAPAETSGATGSRLLSGNLALAEKAEAWLSEAFGYSRCLIFPTGYMANLGVLSALPRRGDLVLYDQYAHACIKDGARLSQARYQSFRHNDVEDLKRRLSEANRQAFVVVESVYSMDGDEAPLEKLVKVTQDFGAELIVDEAHATGIRGKNGGGLTEAAGLQDQVLATIYTFGKGMGAHGAAVAARKEVIDYLVNFSRPFIYTTGLPPATYQHLLNIQEEIREDSSYRQRLQENIEFFLTCWKESGPSALELLPSRSPVQAVLKPGNDPARALARALQSDGYDVRPILSPTVPRGRERLRVCLHAFNTNQEISGLVNSLKTHTKQD